MQNEGKQKSLFAQKNRLQRSHFALGEKKRKKGMKKNRC